MRHPATSRECAGEANDPDTDTDTDTDNDNDNDDDNEERDSSGRIPAPSSDLG